MIIIPIVFICSSVGQYSTTLPTEPRPQGDGREKQYSQEPRRYLETEEDQGEKEREGRHVEGETKTETDSQETESEGEQEEQDVKWSRLSVEVIRDGKVMELEKMILTSQEKVMEN